MSGRISAACERALKMVQSGRRSIAESAKACGISRSTLYRAIKRATSRPANYPERGGLGALK